MKFLKFFISVFLLLSFGFAVSNLPDCKSFSGNPYGCNNGVCSALDLTSNKIVSCSGVVSLPSCSTLKNVFSSQGNYYGFDKNSWNACSLNYNSKIQNSFNYVSLTPFSSHEFKAGDVRNSQNPTNGILDKIYTELVTNGKFNCWVNSTAKNQLDCDLYPIVADSKGNVLYNYLDQGKIMFYNIFTLDPTKCRSTYYSTYSIVIQRTVNSGLHELVFNSIDRFRVNDYVYDTAEFPVPDNTISSGSVDSYADELASEPLGITDNFVLPNILFGLPNQKYNVAGNDKFKEFNFLIPINAKYSVAKAIPLKQSYTFSDYKEFVNKPLRVSVIVPNVSDLNACKGVPPKGARIV